MPNTQLLFKPGHKAIKNYYERLAQFKAQNVSHEGAVRKAFEDLLAQTAKVRKWTLIPELAEHLPGRLIRPDGTLRDSFYIPRGYWEAKDTNDNLEAEIRKKIGLGYPTTNTIFEDTQSAILYQDQVEVFRADLTNTRQLADLLNLFYAHSEPNIDQFEKAVDEFKQRVPELALGLAQKVRDAHTTNKQFAKAFADFFELCKASLNPNMSQAAVDEMLVQHLLTERLIRTIFDNEEFTKRNVIAGEVEKVIQALVSKSFNRKEFLKTLDRFYVAIEDAARTLTHYTEKQHFLNTIYERFFQGYSIKIADTHGIVYTPQPIVDFMCASVEEVLKEEFGLHLWSKGVNILDPCTGTGNFIVNLIDRMPKRELPRVYREQLFANEVMLLPYYIAMLNIEHAYYERTEEYQTFEGLCFVDTLDMVGQKQTELAFISKKNSERVNRQARTPITVVIGNPPYNVGQLNENDNNKNRKYESVDQRIRDTYSKASTASLKTKLYDPYVRFFRWAADRIGDREGIVCLVSNNSFVHKNSFDGMRKHLHLEFDKVYHLDLFGDVRVDPTLTGTAYNVFGIEVGVGITICIKGGSGSSRQVSYASIPKELKREAKYRWLVEQIDSNRVTWANVVPDDRHSWLIPEYGEAFAAFMPMISKEGKALKRETGSIFTAYSLGQSTNRDTLAYGFDQETLGHMAELFCGAYNSELDRFRRAGVKSPIDEFVDYGKMKWSLMLKNKLARGREASFDPGKIVRALYRPFCKRWLYFDSVVVDAPAHQPLFFPASVHGEVNRAIVISDQGFRSEGFSSMMTDLPPDLHLCATLDGHQTIPYWIYNETGSHKKENIGEWALDRYHDLYSDKSIKKWDVFYYVYGVLHHPGYRTKYADNLKRELPRIPYAPDFWTFSKAGKALAKWHLEYETVEPYELKYVETPKMPLSYLVADKMRMSKDKKSLLVNPSLTLAGIPEEAFEYRLGNRSALDWVIDQYQVTVDKRTGIKSDPNRADDPEYIVRLVGQVIRVSLETVKLVKGLPKEFEPKR